jgi:hypothetical protein
LNGKRGHHLALGLQLHAQLLQALLEGVAAAELAQHDLVGAPAHVLGAHDLVGVARLEHAVLVDAAGMGEGVGADDGLVGLHHEARGGLTILLAATICVVSMPTCRPK